MRITKSITANDSENLTRYFAEIRKYQSLTKEQEKVLIIRIQKKGGDKKALDQLVKANIRFVVSVAKRYQGQGVPLLDLISEGNSGLMEAAKRFDVSKDLKFFSYAVWWIRIKIFASMDFNKRTIQIPANRQMLVQKVKRELLDLEQQLNRTPTMDELADRLKGQFTTDDLIEAVTYGARTRSIHESLDDDEDGEGTLEDLIKGDQQIDEIDKDVSILKDIDRFLYHLSQREYDLMILSLGLNKEPQMRYQDLAKCLGIKEKDIANIKARAMKRLKKLKNVSDLKEYL